jgi:hypothetical protein
MALRHLEHDGHEDFEVLQVTNRHDVQVIENDEVERQPSEEQTLEKLQIEYMNPENPDLWDGEI